MNHYHWYGGVTEYINEHNHGVESYTGPAIPCDDSHVHQYQGVTTTDREHHHVYEGVTGIAIPTPKDGHIHSYFDDRHDHPYGTFTGPEIPAC